MNTRKLVFAAIGVVLLVILWLIFRPEKLFLNKRVDEPLPGQSQVLPMGGHDTAGMARIVAA